MVQLALINGNVTTLDDQSRSANAVGVQGDRIAAVGDDAEILALTGPSTRVIDLRGRTVVPGLIDGHAHMDREGLKGVYPSLAGAGSIDDILEIIAGLVAAAEPGEWIVTMPIGEPPSYWNVPGNLRERRFPTRWELDRVAPNNPVYIRPIWGYWRHTLPLVSVANSYALRLAGVTRHSIPACGSIQIDKDFDTGEPTGIFLEWSYMPVLELTVFSMIPGFTHEQRVAGLSAAMAAYNAVGTTGVFEEHGAAAELLRAYQAVHRQGGMTVRTRLAFSPPWSTVNAMDAEALCELLRSWGAWLGTGGLGDALLQMGGLFVSPELTVENSLRSQAAPYTGWAGFNYDTALGRDQLKAVLIEAARNDIRPGGLSMDLLDVYEEVHEVVPIDEKRWVIGHLSVVTPPQIEQIKRLGLVLTTHTNRHIRREGHLHRERVGPEAEGTIVPLRTLLDAGVHVALATDNVPISLFHPIWHCVARIDGYTTDVIAPDQKITREEALRAATIEGAYLTFEEQERGTIEVGKLADVAVLSADPLTVAEDAMRDITADMTVLGGNVVFERSPS